MLREPDLSQYLAGIGGFQSPDDHHAGFVCSVPADLPDDRVASDFIGDPGGDGVSYGMAGVQSVYRHLLPEEDWKAYEYVDMPECWYIKKRNRSFMVRVICFSFFKESVALRIASLLRSSRNSAGHSESADLPKANRCFLMSWAGSKGICVYMQA